MAIEAKVSLISLLEKRMADTLTVQQMEKLTGAAADILDGFDVQEIAREDDGPDLLIIHIWAEFARERDLQFFTAKHLEDIAQWADDAIALLKEQETLKEKLLRNIADNQLAVSPTGYETEEELAKRTGEWNGLQMAYEIVLNDGN